MSQENLNLSDEQDGNSPVANEPLLPRSAWTSQIAYLRVLFRAKKALERAEQKTVKH